MGAGHSHGHDDGDADWSTWLRRPGLRVVLVAVGVCALATLVGVVALWPDGSGRDAAIAEADELGLVTDRFPASVERVSDGPCSYSTVDNRQSCRLIVVVPSEGPDAGFEVELPEFNTGRSGFAPDVSVGDGVIVGYEPATDFYFYADRDRRATLSWLLGLFVLVVVVLARLRGALALAAMGFTVAVLIGFVAPSVLDGHDPLLVSLVAAAVVAFVSLYLTHGVTPTTTVALAGTLGALALTLGVSWAFFELAHFTGLATEEALVLPAVAENLDLSALLLGGAMIGALGALDDVTVTQVATVAELRRRRPDLPTGELVVSGIRVGREHIASTVNTLLLAYAGASMPLLLLFALSNQSLAMVANSELVAVEIARTLCGSIGLVAAVPLTTALAAALLTPDHPEPTEVDGEPEPSTPPDPPPPEPEAAPVSEAPPAPSWDDFSPRDDLGV